MSAFDLRMSADMKSAIEAAATMGDSSRLLALRRRNREKANHGFPLSFNVTFLSH